MATMIELFTPLISTIVGIGGAFLQRKHERKMFELNNEKLSIEHKQELELTKLEMQANREETEQEIALAETQGNIQAFMGSQTAERELSNIQWGKSKLGDLGNFTRVITRPLLTWYLVIVTSVRSCQNFKLVKAKFGQSKDLDAMKMAFDLMMNNSLDVALVAMTSMCLGWWFGSRGSKTSYQDAHYTRTQ